MATRTTVVLKKVKVRELLNTSATKPWNELDADLKAGANNPLIANSKAGPLIGTFSSIVSAITPFFTVSKVVEFIKPKLGLVVKAVGAFTNPSLIPDLAQDLIVIIQSLILNKIVSTVTKTGNKILNTEIILKNITREQFEKLQDSIEKFQIDSENSVVSSMDSFSYSVSETSDTINEQQFLLDSNLDVVIDSVSSNIDALNTNGMSIEEVRASVLQIVGEVVNSSQLVVITPEDEELFMYVDKELKAMVAKMNEHIGEGIASLVIDTSSITRGLDSESLAVFNELKNGFKDMTSAIISGNKEGIFEVATYKENSEIADIVNLLKKLIDIEVVKVKKRYYDDIKYFVENEPNVQVIKDGTKTVTIIKVNIYDILSNKIFRIEISKMKQANEEALYIFDEFADEFGEFGKFGEGTGRYYAGFNKAAYDQAKNIFDVYKVDVIKYLLAGDIVFINNDGFGIGINQEEIKNLKSNTPSLVTKRGYRVTSDDIKKAVNFFSLDYNFKTIRADVLPLESNQFLFSGNMPNDIVGSIITYINNISFFEKNEFISDVIELIDNYSMIITNNVALVGVQSIDFKSTEFRNDLYRNYKDVVASFSKKIPNILGKINFITSTTVTEEKILLYLNDIVTDYLESILYYCIEIVLLDAVPCKKYIKESDLISKTIKKLYNGTNCFKIYLKDLITKKYDTMVFSNDTVAMKEYLLLYFGSDEFRTEVEFLYNSMCGSVAITSSFNNVLRDQESKIFKFIVEKMESL